MTEELTKAARDALEAMERYQVKRQDFERFADEIATLRAALPAPQQAKHDQFADASKVVSPVALRSVRLTRDTAGMCVVRVNGRVAIRDNGDIIDHTATLEWFADTQHAASLVKPGGNLVAILPASAKGKDFDGLDCAWHGPYDNEFAGTSISVVILEATKETR